jgi:hypothetical protein
MMTVGRLTHSLTDQRHSLTHSHCKVVMLTHHSLSIIINQSTTDTHPSHSLSTSLSPTISIITVVVNDVGV